MNSLDSGLYKVQDVGSCVATSMKVHEYLNENLVCFLDANSKEEALRKLVAHSCKYLQIEPPDQFLNAVLGREALVSTGVGLGVAVPHAKLSCFDSFFICIGLAKRGIEWHSIDSSPVRIIFLIGGPDDKQTEYLQILSSLTSAIRDDDLRKQLLAATTPEEVIGLFDER